MIYANEMGTVLTRRHALSQIGALLAVSFSTAEHRIVRQIGRNVARLHAQDLYAVLQFGAERVKVRLTIKVDIR